jgi:hypothetical protein
MPFTVPNEGIQTHGIMKVSGHFEIFLSTRKRLQPLPSFEVEATIVPRIDRTSEKVSSTCLESKLADIFCAFAHHLDRLELEFTHVKSG